MRMWEGMRYPQGIVAEAAGGVKVGVFLLRGDTLRVPGPAQQVRRKL